MSDVAVGIILCQSILEAIDSAIKWTGGWNASVLLVGGIPLAVGVTTGIGSAFGMTVGNETISAFLAHVIVAKWCNTTTIRVFTTLSSTCAINYSG